MEKSTLYGNHILLKKKKISCKELTQDVLSKAKINRCNEYITILEDLCLNQAKQISNDIQKNGLKSILHGIPYGLKDLFITKDIRTTAGSRYLLSYVPPYQGFMADVLEKEGAILIGKLNCDEFGMGSTGEKSAFGPTKNPFNDDYVSGGSSSGTAASLAQRSAIFGLGTDTGGSARLPANYCGVVGFRPTYGRVSRFGQIAYASSLDQASPMANSVFDIACLCEVIFKKDIKDATQIADKFSCVSDLMKSKASVLSGKKLGIMSNFIELCDEAVKKKLYIGLSIFKKMGIELVEIEMPHFDYGVAVYYIISPCEASSNLARYDGIHYGRKELLGDKKLSMDDIIIGSRKKYLNQEVRTRIALGTFALSSGYKGHFFNKAAKVRRLIAHDFKKSFERCDMIFMPVAQGSAKKFERKDDFWESYLNDRFTIPSSLAGLPSLAIPFEKINNMPTGFQLIGNKFLDKEVLMWGHLLKKRYKEINGRIRDSYWS